MKKPARRAPQLSLESFADLVWAVPIQPWCSGEAGGRLLRRALGLPPRGRRIILLRGIEGDRVPSQLGGKPSTL